MNVKLEDIVNHRNTAYLVIGSLNRKLATATDPGEIQDLLERRKAAVAVARMHEATVLEAADRELKIVKFFRRIFNK